MLIVKISLRVIVLGLPLLDASSSTCLLRSLQKSSIWQKIVV